MKYAYVRVSSRTQSVQRQLFDLQPLHIPKENIYIDFQSGMDFQREQYQELKMRLKKGDVLYVKSIDRLGRNYTMIQEEWKSITKDINADIIVIDLPLLDTTRRMESLVDSFIADLVLEVLSFVAENERTKLKERQAEGIRIAKLKGTKFGRKKVILPLNFEEIVDDYVHDRININEALEILQISKNSFYKYAKIFATRDKNGVYRLKGKR